MTKPDTKLRDRALVSVLIIGAGPFGLSLAARLGHLGIDHRIVGDSMGFWRHNMPSGMALRSSWDWHLDPQEHWTIERFFEERGIVRDAVSPIPISTYLDYAEWFRLGSGIDPEGVVVDRLDRQSDGCFVAQLTNSEEILARNVVLSLGFSSFSMLPTEVVARLPPGVAQHTLEAVDFSRAAGKRYLIVGGRQSAFEWGALLAEAGAASIAIVHRHPSPAFAEADWAWVPPLMEQMVANPAWFRSLPAEEQRALGSRLWGEGRLKVEPWLEPRLRRGPVSIWPQTTIETSAQSVHGINVDLSNGRRLQVDHIILATGYKPDLSRIELLHNSPLLAAIDQENGLPLLDMGFQTSVPGLYMTSLLASREFGPFFGFTVASRGAATVLGNDLARRLS